MTRPRPTFAHLVPAILALLVLAACGSSRDSSSGGAGFDARVLPPGEAADGLAIAFASRPDPPQQGDNQWQVSVKRTDGSPVTDATVTAVFSMPAMPAMNMPAMRSETALAHEGEGRYLGTGKLSMGGTWQVAIAVREGSGTAATRRHSIIAR